jgi:CheY-like chemotaxis protein
MNDVTGTCTQAQRWSPPITGLPFLICCLPIWFIPQYIHSLILLFLSDIRNKNAWRENNSYVDDDVDDRELLCNAILALDPSIKMLHTDNGHAALKKLEELKSNSALPDLVILDINMPVIGGREVVEEMMHDKKLSQIPVIVFSTSTNPMDVNFFSRYGLEVWKKPDSYSSILDSAKKMLDKIR